jgi:hypothetical protein
MIHTKSNIDEGSNLIHLKSKNRKQVKLFGKIIVQNKVIKFNKMKKMVVAVLLLFFGIDGFSQVSIGVGSGGFGMGMRVPINGKKQRAQNLENKVQQIKSDLNLDSAQTVQVRSLLVERDRKKSKREPMPREEFNKRMDEILTVEQKEKFQEMGKQKRETKDRQPRPVNNADSTKTKQAAPDTEWDDVYK